MCIEIRRNTWNIVEMVEHFLFNFFFDEPDMMSYYTKSKITDQL